MTTYLVVKRMNELGRTFMPMETVVDIPRADILIHRGYLQVVPDDYAEKAAAASTEAASRVTVEQAIALGYSEKAAKHIAAQTNPLPKYVQEEKEKVEAKEARRTERTQAELDRLAIVLGTTADEVLDLDDDDYAKVLGENPSPAGTAASDPSEVGDDHSDPAKDLPPFETLMAMPEEGLIASLADKSLTPTLEEGWYKDEDRRAAIVREILTAAGYSGEVLLPQPPPPEETNKPE